MTPAFTLFSTARPFIGLAAVQQRNAVMSWLRPPGSPQVVMIGDDPGVAELCDELELDFVPDVRRTESRLPYVSDVFRLGQLHAKAPVSGFANADIVFVDDLAPALEAVAAQFDRFLLVGQRWDLRIEEPIDFTADWRGTLRSRIDRGEGVLKGPHWLDYFCFPTGMLTDLPDLVVGRPGWDNWIIWHARQLDVPVVDATDALLVVHHEHERKGARSGTAKSGIDANANEAIIGSERHMFTVGHATHQLHKDGTVGVARGVKYVGARVLTAAQPVVRATRGLRHRLHLDADTVQKIAARRRTER